MRSHSVPTQILQQKGALPTHISLEPLFPQLTPVPQEKQEALSVDSLQIQDETPDRVCITRILHEFIRREKRGRGQKVKLENLRYRVMRGLKKALRGLLGLSKKSIKVRLLPKEFEGNRSLFEEFRKWAACLQSKATEFAELGNGPKADSHRSPKKCRFSTYNNAYMRETFQQREIRLVYRLYVAVIFSDDDSESLCQRMKIACCTQSSHSRDCFQKWNDLRRAFDQYLGAEVPQIAETLHDLQASL